MRFFRLPFALLFALALLTPGRAQAPQSAPPEHATSTPYTGPLNVFDEPGRDRKLQINRVMDQLHIHAGSTVADIGAGGGWFTVRAARRVGPKGKVVAEDINPRAIDYIRHRASQEHLGNIQTLLGTPDDPHLQPDSLDAAVMLRVYHEIVHPPMLLHVLYRALKPGARFGVIDHPGNGADHGINASVVRAEVERSGFHFVALYDFTKEDQGDYFLIFDKR